MTDQNEMFGWSKAGVLRQGEQSPTDSEVTHSAALDVLRAEVARLKAEHADEIAWMKRGAANCVLDEREACRQLADEMEYWHSGGAFTQDGHYESDCSIARAIANRGDR